MGLDTTVRSGVKIIDTVTKSLQCKVQHKAWKGADTYGTPQYASAVLRDAIVEQQQQQRKLPDGQYVMTKAQVMFIFPVPPNGAAGRVEPVDPRDIITLPDGTTGPILNISGFMDKGTGRPFFSEIWI